MYLIHDSQSPFHRKMYIRLSHLTSITPTKSNLYFEISSATALREPALYVHTSNVPSTKSHTHFLLLRSFIQGICPGLRLLVIFRNKLIFYGEELLAPHPTPKLQGHISSAVHDCLFNIFAATLHLEAISSILNLRTYHAW
jgi:hypothetical protein